MTILIVDEEPVAALTLAAVFQKSGYRALRASTAQRAFATVTSEPVDVVIMDDQLESAHLLGRRLKELHPSPALVVFSSVPMNPEAAGYADLFVPKPENPRRLLHRVAALLKHARHHADADEWDTSVPRAA